MQTEFQTNTLKKVPINLHQWLLGAQVENNVLLLLQERVSNK